MQEELGPAGEDPGNTIWRGVQRLGMDLLDAEETPPHYTRMKGFRRLVFDLTRGDLKE